MAAGVGQCTNKGRDRQLTVFINTNIKDIVNVIFIFQPCTTIRNDRRAEQFLTGLIVIHFIINTR